MIFPQMVMIHINDIWNHVSKIRGDAYVTTALKIMAWETYYREGAIRHNWDNMNTWLQMAKSNTMPHVRDGYEPSEISTIFLVYTIFKHYNPDISWMLGYGTYIPQTRRIWFLQHEDDIITSIPSMDQMVDIRYTTTAGDLLEQSLTYGTDSYSRMNMMPYNGEDKDAIINECMIPSADFVTIIATRLKSEPYRVQSYMMSTIFRMRVSKAYEWIMARYPFSLPLEQQMAAVYL
jgi:hypothetical protein